MTYREECAKAAMVALLSAQDAEEVLSEIGREAGISIPTMLAKIAFEIADAMVAARDAKGGK